MTLSAFGQKKEGVTRVPPRNIVPLEVKARAKAAAQIIMDKTVRGDNQAAIDAMNPDYLKVAARGAGGVVKFKEKLLRQMNAMGQNGINLQAAITQPADTAFEVGYGFKDMVVNGEKIIGSDGKPVQEAGYLQWMVYVPTVIEFTVLDEEAKPAKLRTFRRWSFEIAISPKGKENWTFINGNNINALQLRQIFPFLPPKDKDLKFPLKKIEERTKKQ